MHRTESLGSESSAEAEDSRQVGDCTVTATIKDGKHRLVVTDKDMETSELLAGKPLA